ncbi:MAG: hypothetical protein RRY64_07080 [Oscillospiraceae bacterium]
MKKAFLFPLVAALLVLSVAGRLACVLSGRVLGLVSGVILLLAMAAAVQGLFLQAAAAVALALVLGVLPHLGTAVFGKLGDLAETISEI